MEYGPLDEVWGRRNFNLAYCPFMELSDSNLVLRLLQGVYLTVGAALAGGWFGWLV